MYITAYHPFKSLHAKEKYLKSYENAERFWPVPYETRLADTTYGQTLVRISGPADAPTLVLLHGICCSSLMWLPQIEGLSQDYRTYAVDDIYDYGRSIYTKVVNSKEDYVIWLNELFNALGLEKNITFIGMSYGGWQASQYAVKFPERLKGIVLIAPAATVLPMSLPGRLVFKCPFLRAFMTIVIPRNFFKSQMRLMVNDYRKKNLKAMESFIDNYSLAIKCFIYKSPPNPTVLQDDELNNLKVPALFIVGENERIYSAQKALRRLRRIAPQIKIELIPHAGHNLLWVNPEMVNLKILEFLQRNHKRADTVKTHLTLC